MARVGTARGMAAIGALALGGCDPLLIVCEFEPDSKACVDAMAEVGLAWKGESDIYGAHLYIRDRSAPWTQDDRLLRAQVRHTIEVAAAYWGVSPHFVRGWRIEIKDGHASCPNWEGPVDGCTNDLDTPSGLPGRGTITVITGVATSMWSEVRCFEETVFYHEMGHLRYPLGDPGHWSPGWRDHARQERFWYQAQEEAIAAGLCPNQRILYDPDWF